MSPGAGEGEQGTAANGPANGCNVSFWDDENVVELDSGNGCTAS